MKKLLVVLSILLLSLTGCTPKVVASTNDYSYVFSTDLRSMDYVTTYRNTDHVHNANFVDGLQENDPYGNFVSALATKVEHNDDYTVWTYTLREGVNWVKADGTVYAEVVAQDFITGLRHAIDFASNMSYIVSGSIKGLSDYQEKGGDFSTVGVKALDKYTLEYTLNAPEPWWNTKTTYSILFPINEEFLNSKGEGCKLGAPDKPTCQFGTPIGPDAILYNGGYILSSFQSKSLIEYKANPNYWDAEHVYVPNVKLVYYNGSDPSSLLRNFEAGQYSTARIYTENYASALESHFENVFTSVVGATTYNITFNLARETYNWTSKDDSQKADTAAAMLNRNFRQALQFGFDKISYLAQSKGTANLAKLSVRNTMTPPNFDMYINYTDLTLPGDAKNYGDLVEAALAEMYGSEFADIELDDGQNPYYVPDTAKAYLAKAKTELGDVAWPIHLDMIVDNTDDVGIKAAQSLKNSIETSLGVENVVIDLQIADEDSYLNATYYAEDGYQSDFDISTASGWGPDYLDPKTYLDIYDSRDGDMLATLGLNLYNPKTAGMEAAILKVGFSEYEALIDAAAAETTDLSKRYALYAKADAWLVYNAVQIPVQADGGNPVITYVKPFTASFAVTGISMNKFKFIQVTDTVVLKADRDKAYAAWLKELTK